MKKNILILGGDSKIGKSIEKYFTSMNFEVYKTTRKKSKKISDKKSINIDLKNTKTFSDLNNLEFDYVIFCAGISSIKSCFDHQENARIVNVINTKKLISLLVNKCDKLIFLSSSQIFSEKNPQSPGDIPSPTTVYGKYKKEVEDYIKNFENVFIIRLTKVIFNDDTLFKDWNNKIKNREKIVVCKNLFLSPISEIQLSEKIFQCLTFDQINRIVHFSASDQISYADFASYYLTHKKIDLTLLEIQECKENLSHGIRPNLNSILIELDDRLKFGNSLENIKKILV